jgi:hypothetical protein
MIMKKMITAALVVALSIYLSQYSSQKEKDTPYNVKTVKEKTNKLDIQFTLANSVSITDIKSPIRIFFNENILHVYGAGRKESNGPQMIVVQRFAKNLESLDKKYIPIGQGPGDLGEVPRFSGCGELIYVTDYTQHRISVFNKDLEFVKVVRVKGTGVSIYPILMTMGPVSCAPPQVLKLTKEAGKKSCITAWLRFPGFPLEYLRNTDLIILLIR